MIHPDYWYQYLAGYITETQAIDLSYERYQTGKWTDPNPEPEPYPPEEYWAELARENKLECDRAMELEEEEEFFRISGIKPTVYIEEV